MEKLSEIQKEFFKQIRVKLLPNISFVHDISELLGISYDSAYRRIRGEKYLNGLMQKSTLISRTSAKERNRFFNKLLAKVDEFKSSL